MINFINKNFWPIDKMKDCSVGNAIQKFKAYEYNQTKINLLVGPILNWIICVLINYLGLMFFEHLSKSTIHFIYLAAMCGIGMAVSVIGGVILSVAYIFLKNLNAKISNYI